MSARRRLIPEFLPDRPTWRWWIYGAVMSSIVGGAAGLVMALVAPVVM